MRRQGLLGLSAIAALALLLGQGYADAQAPGTQPPPPVVAPGPMSPAQSLTEANTILSRMDSTRGIVRRQLEVARAQRDVVKTLCLNDKLNQLDVAIRSATERRQALELAVGRGDADQASHDFTILAVFRQRTEQLAAEANQCIGREAEYIGDTAVTPTGNPNLPDEESTDVPIIDIVSDIPPCSSCFK